MEREEFITEQRIAGIAIETVTTARAALHYHDPQAVRDMISEAEETIDAFARGQVPPGSDELYAVIDNLIVRETLPYGIPQHDTADILTQLRNAGLDAPDINIAATLSEHAVLPLSATALEKQLGTQPKQPTQETTRKADADITIYTTPNCMGCAATKRQFDKMGVDYLVIDLSKRPDLVENFKAQGLAQAPIVQTSTDTWSGMRPDKIKEVGRDYQSRTRTNNTGTNPGYER